MLDLLRTAPPWRKLAMLGEMHETLRTLMLTGLRQRHPQASPAELKRRLADLWLGPELAAKVYGPLAEEPSNADRTNYSDPAGD